MEQFGYGLIFEDEMMIQKIYFRDIEGLVPGKPGIYEIFMNDGRPLKVGISSDLRRRLLLHRASRQSGLKSKHKGPWDQPKDVQSKSSIFTKHLYFDRSLVCDLDLTLEVDRRKFLEERCYITFEWTASKEAARELEKDREQTGQYRYVGRVRVRQAIESADWLTR